MLLIIDQSLAAGFIPVNAQQQRASLPFKPGVLERKVYNNDDITFFSILTFVKRPGSGCNILSHFGKANINTLKIMFYHLINVLISQPKCTFML